MRLLGYLLLFAVVGALGFGTYVSWTTEPLVEGSPYPLEGESEPQRSQLYLFQDQTPMEYVLSQSPEKLLLSSVAFLSELSGKTLRHQYGVMFETLSAEGNLLEARQFSFGSYIAEQVEVKGYADKVPEYFTLDANTPLASPQNIYVDIGPEVKKVRVTLMFKGTRVKNVGLRLYQKVQRNSRLEPIDVWSRLSRSQKQNLTEYYPFALSELTDEERGNLARFRWQPVLPLGVEGESYQLSALFSVPKAAITLKESLLDTQQNMADQQRHVTFPIHEPGTYHLSLQHAFGDRPFEVHASWHGMEKGQIQSFHFPLNQSTSTQEIQLEKGLLDINTSIPVAVELHSQQQEVVEHQHLVGSYLIHQDQPLTFSLLQNVGSWTPIRVNVQQYADADVGPQKTGKSEISLLDEKGSVWRSFEIKSASEQARYQQLYGTEFFNWLSEVETRYLNVPPHVSRIRISSNGPHLVRVSTRPHALASQRTLPQQKKGWFDYEGRIADWFAITPNDFTQLINEGRILMVKYYHQPSVAEEVDEAWQFESVVTHNPEYAVQTLMLPVVENLPEQAVSAVRFQSLPLPSQVDWEQVPLVPTVFFVKESAEAEQIYPYLNKPLREPSLGEQEALPSFWIAGKWGEAYLPAPLSPQEIKQLRLPQHIDWFINHAGLSSRAMDKRRAVYLTPNEPLYLNIEKTQDVQLLTFVAYPTQQAPVEVRVEVMPEEEFTPKVFSQQHTFLTRRIIIHPDSDTQAYQLYSDKRLKARALFFLALGDDLPNRAIKVKLSILKGDGTYINAVHKVAKDIEMIKRFSP